MQIQPYRRYPIHVSVIGTTLILADFCSCIVAAQPGIVNLANYVRGSPGASLNESTAVNGSAVTHDVTGHGLLVVASPSVTVELRRSSTFVLLWPLTIAGPIFIS